MPRTRRPVVRPQELSRGHEWSRLQASWLERAYQLVLAQRRAPPAASRPFARVDSRNYPRAKEGTS